MAPRLARALLRIIAPADRRDDVLGDLNQVHRRTLAERGPVLAWWMTMADALSVAGALVLYRFRDEGWRMRGFIRIPDLTHALRLLFKRPGFSLAVILTLALGIGGNTAVFSLINAVMLRPLPYEDSERLYMLMEQDSTDAQQLPSYPTFVDWHDQADAFEGLAFVRGTSLTYRTGDQTGLLLGAFVTEEFFPLMGVPAARGRSLLPDDFGPAAGHVVVVSHTVWTQWLGGSDSVIGSTLVVDESPFIVVGVMPPTFAYPDWGVDNHLWMPITALPSSDQAVLSQRDFHADSRVVAKLKSDLRLTAANAQMNVVAGSLADEYAETSARWTSVAMRPLQEFAVGSARSRLLMLAGAVTVVLLICCLNLANLYLVQTRVRRREYAIRAALGAGRRRVLQQLLTESLVLCILGGGLGTVLAVMAIDAVAAGSPLNLPRMAELHVDSAMLAFAGGLTVLTALLFAAVGARSAGSRRLAEGMLSRSTSGGGSGGWGRIPSFVQAAQIGLSFVLLIGAGLLTQTFLNMSRADFGLDTDRLLTVRINPPSPTYDSQEAAIDLFTRLIESVNSLPDIESVTVINHGPMSGGGAPSWATFGGAPTGSDDDVRALYRTISPGYFSMLGIPVVQGREFNGNDEAGGPGPIIINETLAKQWTEGSPVGQTFGVIKAARTRADFGEPLVGRVVGVVGDLNRTALGGSQAPVVYVPLGHNPWPEVNIVARSRGPAEAMLAAVEDAVHQVEPTIPLDGPFVGASAIKGFATATAGRRFNATVVSVFALVALLLASVGMYGVIAYTVSLRTREIGVRMALGATPHGVLESVVHRVAHIAMIGLGLGVAAAFALTRLLEGLLYQVEPRDPATFIGVGTILMVVAILAGYLPARRAGKVDPLIALRGE